MRRVTKVMLATAAAVAALVGGSAAAGPIEQLAKNQIKRDLDAALERAEKGFPGKSDPMNPKPEPSSFKGRVEKTLTDHFGPLVRQTAKGIKESDGYKALSPHDAGLKVDVSPKGMPRVPSKCAESAGCGSCFAKGQADLKQLRFSLEKLRAIGSWTTSSPRRASRSAIRSPASTESLAWAGSLSEHGSRRATTSSARPMTPNMRN
jgi:hypothetical protein